MTIQEATILIVDDNPTNLDVLFESLSQVGFKVLVAKAGESAIRQAERAQPDVILLDILMPGLDGFETCRRLKKKVETKDIPVIFLSALSDTIDKVEGFKIGAVDYITKPFQQEEVLARLETHLTIQGLQKSLQEKNELLKQEINGRKRIEEGLEERVAERTQELQDAQEQLVRQEKLATMGQLAGSVAHELRNPLGILSNSVYFLKTVLSDADETVKEYLEMSALQIHKSEKIISDLLNFSRAGLDERAEREEVWVSTLVSQVLTEQPPPEAVKVSIQIPPDLPPVFVDLQQIGQVLTNLVINAYQAMPHKGKLTLLSYTQEDSVILAVSDTGAGISPEHKEKLFEPLFTTKIKGIGLGLAVSKDLVEANRGTIEVESEVGQGTIFTIRLPLSD